MALRKHSVVVGLFLVASAGSGVCLEAAHASYDTGKKTIEARLDAVQQAVDAKQVSGGEVTAYEMRRLLGQLGVAETVISLTKPDGDRAQKLTDRMALLRRRIDGLTTGAAATTDGK